MRYMGSKGKYAKYIVPHLMESHDDSCWYVEPFVGGGNLFSQVPASKKWGNDVNKWSIALLDALSKGWEPPETLSETEYYQVKEDPHGYDPALVGFAAFCCSYAGKEWGGYARGNTNKGVPRNFASEQARNLEKQRPGLIGARFTCNSYTEIHIPADSTVYCDPPYLNTTAYKDSIDYALFWDWCEGLSNRGCNVFVSEYEAPSRFECVWEKEVTNSLTKDTGSKKGTERLFKV